MSLTKIHSNGQVTVFSGTMDDIVKLSRKTFKKQRCHEVRVNTALHTHGKLEGPKQVFSAGECKRTRVLVDGYSRVEAYLNGDVQVEGEVILMVYKVANLQDALERLYDQFDNRKASKYKRDYIAGGLRNAGFNMRDMSSGLLLKGALTLAVVSAAGIPDTRRAATRMAKGIKRLNSLDMAYNHRTVSAGVLAGFIAIAQYEANMEIAASFIRGIHAHRYLATDKADQRIAKFQTFHEDRKATRTCSGAENIASIRDALLLEYVQYKRISLKQPALRGRARVTLDEFVSLLKAA
jgi:hypothetical protein